MSRIRILGAAIAAAGCALAVTVGLTASSAGAAPSACGAVHMAPTFQGNRVAGGKFNDYWWLINKGSASCSISGFPQIVDYGSDGRPLRTREHHKGTSASVTVAPGEHARTVLIYADPREGSCKPVPAAGMSISWSGTQYPVIAGRGVRSCGGVLTATAWVHGG